MKNKRPAKIRLSHQINNYFCGPAVAVTLLTAYGIRATQKKVARLAHTTKAAGTSTKGLASALRSFGMQVREDNGRSLRDIHHASREGKTVIVCYTEPRENSGHYAIVERFRGGKIFLWNPDERGNAPISMSVKEFQGRWKDTLFTHSKRWAAFVSLYT